MIYIERKCETVHEGRPFSLGGAIVTPERIVAYVGRIVDGNSSVARRELTDWHGNRLGTCVISSTWRTSRGLNYGAMHQIYAEVDGITYTGRGSGEGMVFRGRAVKK